MITTIRSLLIDPRIASFDPDSDDRIRLHNEILSNKRIMKEVFEEFYNECLSEMNHNFCDTGKVIELGAGVSFFRKLFPELIVTDVVSDPNIDMYLNAQKMTPIEDSSARAFFALNMFHHLPDPDKFFEELLRTLKPGGGCVLIEPFHGTIARPFYRNVHKTEHFNPDQSSWNSDESMGVMSNANQALSYIVFVRDRKLFEEKFPDLEIVAIEPLHNYLRYFLSGGINFRQLLPDITIPILKGIEFLLRPVSYHTALHYKIVLRKRV